MNFRTFKNILYINVLNYIKIKFFLFLLLVACTPAFSQPVEIFPKFPKEKEHLDLPSKAPFFEINIGLLGGTSYYFFNRDDVLNLEQLQQLIYQLQVDNASLGIHFGIHTQFRAGPVFIRPDIVFNSNSVNFKVTDILDNSDTSLAKERYQYLDFPVVVGLDLGSWQFMAGPVGHLFIANQSALVKEITNLTLDYEPFTIGYQLGVGGQLGNMGVDLRYEGSLNRFGEGFEFYGKEFQFSTRPSRLLLTLTFAIY